MSENNDFEEKDEKEMEMHHHHKIEENDVLSTVVWAFILIWAGLVFLASNLNWFDQMGLVISNNWTWSFSRFGVWNLIALGTGAILIVEAAVRLLVPELRHKMGGALIGGIVLIGVGLGGWFSWSYLWPLILIAVGVDVLITGLGRKRE